MSCSWNEAWNISTKIEEPQYIKNAISTIDTEDKTVSYDEDISLTYTQKNNEEQIQPPLLQDSIKTEQETNPVKKTEQFKSKTEKIQNETKKDEIKEVTIQDKTLVQDQFSKNTRVGMDKPMKLNTAKKVSRVPKKSKLYKLVDINAFKKYVQLETGIVVFYADWCKICAHTHQDVQNFLDSNKLSQISIAVVDCSNKSAIANMNNIKGVPTYATVHNKKLDIMPPGMSFQNVVKKLKNQL